MFGRSLFLTAFAFAASIAFSDAQPAPRPEFEVASVKANRSSNSPTMQLEFQPGGRFVAQNAPLLFLIATAYDLPINDSPFLTGLPSWARTSRFDIEATAPRNSIAGGASSIVRDGRMKLMLQSLLEERFVLRIRRDRKEMPVYAIVVAAGGPTLEKSKMT